MNQQFVVTIENGVPFVHVESTFVSVGNEIHHNPPTEGVVAEASTVWFEENYAPFWVINEGWNYEGNYETGYFVESFSEKEGARSHAKPVWVPVIGPKIN
jgi:hypothetical protein